MIDANVYRFVQDTKDRMLMLQLKYLRSDTKRKKHYENENEIIVLYRILSIWKNNNTDEKAVLRIPSFRSKGRNIFA